MFCKYCGKPLDENATYCSYCGKDISETISHGNPVVLKPKSRKPLLLLVCLLCVVVIAAVLVFVLAPTFSATKRTSRHVELGNRYLSILDYEQAVSSFESALKIDPKNGDALSGLTEAYLSWGTSLYEGGDMTAAADVLSRGADTLSEYDSRYASILSAAKESVDSGNHPRGGDSVNSDAGQPDDPPSATGPDEAPVDTVVEVEDIVIDAQLQYDFNIFLCNFIEPTTGQGSNIRFRHFDRENYNVTQLMDFAFNWFWCNRNRDIQAFEVRLPDDFTHSLSLERINYALSRYCNITLTEAQAQTYGSVLPSDYYEDVFRENGRQYISGALYVRWGWGWLYSDIAIVDRAVMLSDGTIRLYFSTYMGYIDYFASYYPLSPDEVTSRYSNELSPTGTGVAVISVRSDGSEPKYYLEKLDIDD